MDVNEFTALEIGDRIEFRAITRCNTRKATRLVTGFPYDHFAGPNLEHLRSKLWCYVRFEGAAGFMVRRSEVIRRVA